jgi:lipopolysaccharide exporter
MHDLTGEDAPLTSRAMQGMKWTAGSQAIGVVLQLGYAAVVSRALPASDFGVIAVAGVLLRFGSYIARAGLGPAIVQRPSLSDPELKGAHRLSLGLGGVFALLVVAAAPLARVVTDSEHIVPVVRVFALDFVIAGLLTAPTALLRRQLRFRALSVIEVASYIGGYLCVGLPLAVGGAGVWSLVAAPLTQSGLKAVFSMRAARFPLVPRGRLREGLPLLRFGAGVSLIGFVEFWSSNADTVGVSKAMSPAAVGQYARASSLMWLPTQQVGNVISTVLSASFARASRVRAIDAYLHGQAVMTIVLGGLTVMLAESGPHIFRPLLGPNWTQAAAVSPFLAVGACLNMYCQLAAVLTEAHKELSGKFKVQMLQLGVLIASLLVVAPYNDLRLFAAAWSFSEAVRLLGYNLLLQHAFDVTATSLVSTYVNAVRVLVLPGLLGFGTLFVLARTSLPEAVLLPANVLAVGVGLLVSVKFVPSGLFWPTIDRTGLRDRCPSWVRP